MSDSKQPPIIINHNESGTFIIGEDKDDTTRVRDIGLYASHADCQLRLFEDGGFNLSSSSAKSGKSGGDDNKSAGSNILQQCIGAPLMISSEGDLTINSAQTLTLQAKNVVIKSSAGEGMGINLDAESDIVINSKKDYICTAENITHDAKEKVLTHSEGWNIIICQHFRISESISQLTPILQRAYIKTVTKNLKG
tara:strand:+ start:45 stop:629 length:585 start_codon:yes stop_codon:yes gene_type:complete